MEDDQGDFWVSMPCGLVRIARSEIDAWRATADAAGLPRKLTVKLFDTSDGVRSRGKPGPYTPHAAKAPDGRLWFFPLEGLNVMDPRRMAAPRP
jgi:hypothetical protein